MQLYNKTFKTYKMSLFKIRRATGPRRVRAPATVPSPWLLFPSGTGLQSWSPEGYHLWYPGRGVWTEISPKYRFSNSLIHFLSVPKINPKIYHVFTDLGSQNGPQNGAKIHKKRFPSQSRNQTPKNNKKIVFPDPPEP